MNILLLTDLYPADAEHSSREISHALHDLVKQWSGTENVLVLRPFIIPDWQRKNRQTRPGTKQLDGVKIWHAPVLKFPWLNCFSLAGLYRGLRKSDFHPQVIVAHLGFNLLWASRMARQLQVPLITAVHLGDLKYGPAMLNEKRLHRIYGQAAGIACRSPIIFRRFVEKYPELKEKCFVAYSGIDRSWLQGDSGATDRFAGWPQKKPIIFCTLASLLKCKNIDINLHVLARIPKAVDWRYKIIGDGPEKSALQLLAASLGISGRVEFTGFLPPKLARRELMASHVFLMISQDTFGLAYLEAMACGLLVIGGRGYGIDGILNDGKNGFLCTPGERTELSSVLEKIIQQMSGAELQTILASAKETVSGYTVDAAAADYLENIRRIARQGNAE